MAGPADHRQGKPNFVFHKSLSALFINPPNLELQNAGFQVETVDINNKVKVINFDSSFEIPDSATEIAHVSLAPAVRHHLTAVQAVDAAGDTFGLVSGERLSEAVAAFESPDGGGGGRSLTCPTPRLRLARRRKLWWSTPRVMRLSSRMSAAAAAALILRHCSITIQPL